MKRAQITSMVTGDRVVRRAPYDVTIADRTVRMYHGDAVLVGVEASPDCTDRPTAVSIALVLPGCDCGCKAGSRGVEFIPSPEHARMLAAQLIEAAQDVENAAKLTATDLIARARRQ